MNSSSTRKESDFKASRMLVELDCLLDTRLAVLATLGDDVVSKALAEGYHERMSDSFNGVTFEEFKEAYAKRDKECLRYALLTPIGKFAHDFALATQDNVNNSPFHYHPVIMVNIHPYKLNEPEVTTILRSVRAITKGLADIEIVDLSYEELSPLYLKLNLAAMVIYEYDQWLEAHAKTGEWKKTTAPDVTVFGPQISMVKANKGVNLDHEAFIAMQEMTRPFVDLKLLPIEMFSSVLKKEHFEKVHNS